MRPKLSAPLLARVLEWLKDANDWEREDKALYSRELRLTILHDGQVQAYCLGFLPFDWTQRRSIARAFKRVHGRMTAELIEAGRAALKDKNTNERTS